MLDVQCTLSAMIASLGICTCNTSNVVNTGSCTMHCRIWVLILRINRLNCIIHSVQTTAVEYAYSCLRTINSAIMLLLHSEHLTLLVVSRKSFARVCIHVYRYCSSWQNTMTGGNSSWITHFFPYLWFSNHTATIRMHVMVSDRNPMWAHRMISTLLQTGISNTHNIGINIHVKQYPFRIRNCKRLLESTRFCLRNKLSLILIPTITGFSIHCVLSCGIHIQ